MREVKTIPFVSDFHAHPVFTPLFTDAAPPKIDPRLPITIEPPQRWPAVKVWRIEP